MPGYNVLDSQLKGNTTENISKYRCPECRLLLREAVQPSCGHWLCLTCAVEIFATKKPRCPRDDCGEELVPEDGQDFFPDRFVRREILNFNVICTNSSLGCPWEGIVSDYEEHCSMCTFAQETCECGKTMLRTELSVHKKTSCPKSKKPCPLSKLGCPKEQAMTNEELRLHFGKTTDIIAHLEILASVVSSVRDKANQAVFKPRPPAVGSDVPVDSGYKSLGSYQGQEADRDGGGNDDKYRMKKLLVSEGPTGERERMPVLNVTDFQLPKTGGIFSDTRLISKLVQEEMEKLRREMKRDYQGEIELRDGRIRVLEQQVSQMQKTLQTKNTEIEDRDFRLSLIENSNYDGTMIWKIPQFSQRMTDAKTGKYTSIFSLPFYSSRYGYKMCLRLYIMGDGIGKGSHMSLFFVIMRGEFDNILSWPFTQRVTFRLINQNTATGRDIVDTFQPDPMSSSFKKPKSDMNIASGCPRFIGHENLKSGGYIVDDTIFIKCVVDRSSMSHP